MTQMHGQFSATHARPRLERRLATLRTLEVLNAVLLPTVFVWWLPASVGHPVPDAIWQRALACVPVGLLLCIGGWYWHRKLQQLRGRRSLAGALPVFARLDQMS